MLPAGVWIIEVIPTPAGLLATGEIISPTVIWPAPARMTRCAHVLVVLLAQVCRSLTPLCPVTTTLPALTLLSRTGPAVVVGLATHHNLHARE